MATETKTSYEWRSEGNKRAVKFRITTSDTDGDIDTGLSRVEYATMIGQDTEDWVLQVFKNSKSAADSDGNNGWIHFVGATGSKVYQVRAVGV